MAGFVKLNKVAGGGEVRVNLGHVLYYSKDTRIMNPGTVLVFTADPSRLLKNTRIGLFSWPSCVSRPPRQRCARGHAVPTRGPATPAAGDQGHLASRFRNRTKL